MPRHFCEHSSLHDDNRKLTKCLEDVGHDLSIFTLLDQAHDLLSLGYLVRVQVKVDNVDNNLRENSCSGHNRRKKAVS